MGMRLRAGSRSAAARMLALVAGSGALALPAAAKVADVAPVGPTQLTDGPPAIDTSWRLEDRADDAAAYAPAEGWPVAGGEAQPSLPVGPPATDERVPDDRYRSFGGRVGAVKWELAGLFAVLTANNIRKVAAETQSFRFQDEGLFGRDTFDLGLDKLAHAYNTYLISEVLYQRMRRKTGGGTGSAVTAAALAAGLQVYGEVFDGIHRGSGFSFGDVGFNLGGAAFSVLRNTVPGLKDKLDFRISIVPGRRFYVVQGKEHFEQEHFLLALKLAGFEGLRNGPLRFVELHVGYHAKDFTIADRLAGIEPKRLPFLGVGFNFAQLFRTRQSWPAKAARTILQYYQIPYTAIHVDLPTGRLSP